MLIMLLMVVINVTMVVVMMLFGAAALRASGEGEWSKVANCAGREVAHWSSGAWEGEWLTVRLGMRREVVGHRSPWHGRRSGSPVVLV